MMSTYSDAPLSLINTCLAQRLVAEQFPQWAYLPIQSITLSGHDNRTYRLGQDKLLRFPSAKAYAAQVEKEQFWLPELQPLLPLPIPEPIGLGQPADHYPYRWSIYRWLSGDTAASIYLSNSDKEQLAQTLAQFLSVLQKIDSAEGPYPGPHNFYRAGALSTYDGQTRRALNLLKQRVDFHALTQVWEAGLATHWQQDPVWVHRDISAGNLLVKKNPVNKIIALSAVIDFGMLAVVTCSP